MDGHFCNRTMLFKHAKLMYEFQEAITHLQEMEEDLVDTHHNVIQTMQNWVQEDSQLISMTQEVDYDQDGNEDTG